MNVIKPLKNNVVIKPEGPAETTEGGIILAKNVIPQVLERATVVAVGDAPECEELKAGDVVLYHRLAGRDNVVKTPDGDLKVVSFVDIYGVIE